MSVTGMCIALIGCDKVTRLEVFLDGGRPIDPVCISNLPHFLGSVKSFTRVPHPASVKGEEFSLSRGTGVVYVGREYSMPHIIRIEFAWMGPSETLQEKDSIQFLKDVQSSVIRACRLQNDKIVFRAECTGSVCRYPEVQEMIHGR